MRSMRLLDSILTAAIFLPFSLLVFFHLFSLLRRTLRGRTQSDGWKAKGALGGVLLLQVGSAGLLGGCLYLIFVEGTGF